MDAARALEDLSGRIGEVEASIRSLPVPETDRMTQRHRQEAETLAVLGECDKRLIGLSGALLQMLEDKDADWILGNITTLRDGVSLMTSQVVERTSLLK